jgi:hypothetical protein
MSKTVLAFGLSVILASLTVAQDNGMLPQSTFGKSVQANAAQPDIGPSIKRVGPGGVPFCPAGTCLYYAGDYDSNWSGANGEFDADDTSNGLEGQTWVGVKPDRDVTVTGATFVEALTSGYSVTNPTPFAVQVGIKPGQAGKTVCSASGKATVTEWGYWQGQIPAYAYTIKRLSHSCRLKRGVVYYVNLLPTSGNGYGYVLNLPRNPTDHYGWKDDLNHCYFNGFEFGANYVTCNSQGNFSELSIALTGK